MKSSDNNQLIEDTRHIQIDNARAMQRLLNNEDFKKLFQEIFIDAYAITNIYNAWTFDDQTRRRFLEKTLARSHFTKFIDDILEDGKIALDSIRDEEALRDNSK